MRATQIYVSPVKVEHPSRRQPITINKLHEFHKEKVYQSVESSNLHGYVHALYDFLHLHEWRGQISVYKSQKSSNEDESIAFYVIPQEFANDLNYFYNEIISQDDKDNYAIKLKIDYDKKYDSMQTYLNNINTDDLINHKIILSINNNGSIGYDSEL